MNTPVAPILHDVGKLTIPSKTTVSSFLKTHERLIIVGIVAIAFWGSYSRVLTYLDNRDARQASVATATLQAQVEANNKLVLASQQAAAQYQAVVQQLTDANNKLLAAQTKRDAVTKKQQTVDETLAPAELANRWTMLLGIPATEVTPTATGYAASQTAALDTTIQLEKIPELQADLAGSEQIVTNDAKQIESLDTVVTNLNAEVVGLDQQISDQTKAYNADVTLLKSQNRISRLRWFGLGFVAGFVAREIVKP